MAKAKVFQPYIEPALAEQIAARYAKMREDAQAVGRDDRGRRVCDSGGCIVGIVAVALRPLNQLAVW